MLFRTHILFGVFVWFILDRVIEMPIFVLLFVLLGTAFVDIDSCSSWIGKKVWFLSWVFRHRGMLHSLVGCLVLSTIVAGFNRWAGFGFFVGYLSHLIIDCFTLTGLKLFWPFEFRVCGFIRSGSWVEDVVFVFVLAVDVWLVFNSLF
ncbi:metal-dependent hydrolase [Candidatus Pacearchaeota archaeon]|nr:metal-dependent hydrolase [Candidatus Pacearchaeota archaeon]